MKMQLTPSILAWEKNVVRHMNPTKIQHSNSNISLLQLGCTTLSVTHITSLIIMFDWLICTIQKYIFNTLRRMSWNKVKINETEKLQHSPQCPCFHYWHSLQRKFPVTLPSLNMWNYRCRLYNKSLLATIQTWPISEKNFYCYMCEWDLIVKWSNMS